jgi:hypothetical protein
MNKVSQQFFLFYGHAPAHLYLAFIYEAKRTVPNALNCKQIKLTFNLSIEMKIKLIYNHFKAVNEEWFCEKESREIS